MEGGSDLELAQRVLDLPALQPYFHVEELPERAPLKVVSDGFRGDLEQLRKFGMPVVLRREEDVKQGDAVLRLRVVERQDDRIRIELEYTPEGLRGSATFTRRADGWQSSDVALAER